MRGLAFILIVALSTAAPAQARAFLGVRDVDLPDDVRDSAELLVSELVSNAVRHGAPDLCLKVRLDRDRLVVAVQDGGPAIGVTPVADVERTRTSGRGLFITATLADAWGVVDDPAVVGDDGGKIVWFALRR